MKKLAEKVRAGDIPIDYLWLSFQSWRANASRGNTHKTVWNMEQLYNELKEGIEHGTED